MDRPLADTDPADGALAPGRWYKAPALDQASTGLADGSTLTRFARTFMGGQVTVLRGETAPPNWYRRRKSIRHDYLQVTLSDVSRDAVSGIPHDLAVRLLMRNYETAVPDGVFPFDLECQMAGQTWFAPGRVLINLNLRAGEGDPKLEDSRYAEVDRAWQRGWLDDMLKAESEIRLRARTRGRHLGALLSSGFLPNDGWQVSVVFAHWYARSQHAPVWGPALADIDPISFRFKPRAPVAAGFQVADLFRRGVAD